MPASDVFLNLSVLVSENPYDSSLEFFSVENLQVKTFFTGCFVNFNKMAVCKDF